MPSAQGKLTPEPADGDIADAVESILLVAGGPVTVAALAGALDADRERVERCLAVVESRLAGGIRLQRHDDRVQLVTAPATAEYVHRFLGVARPPALSRAALETLTVIAYRQPVTRAEIEAVRGVNADRAVQTLLGRGLIEERGRRDTLGRPVEYGTGFGFLEYFGLSSLADLPPLPSDDEETVDAKDLGLRPDAGG